MKIIRLLDRIWSVSTQLLFFEKLDHPVWKVLWKFQIILASFLSLILLSSASIYTFDVYSTCSNKMQVFILSLAHVSWLTVERRNTDFETKRIWKFKNIFKLKTGRFFGAKIQIWRCSVSFSSFYSTKLHLNILQRESTQVFTYYQKSLMDKIKLHQCEHMFQPFPPILRMYF